MHGVRRKELTTLTTIAIQPIPPRARWTTPRLLQASLLAIAITALLLFLAIFSGVRQRRNAVQTIGKDSAPSILAAQRIKASLADMDANVANELMVNLGENSQSIKGYEDDQTAVTESLIHAAENITYGDAERKPILTLASALGNYEELTARARLLHERHDPTSIEVYRRADEVLHNTLFPAADALNGANSTMLTQTYGDVQSVSLITFGLAVLAGAALLIVLISTQLFLSRRMRRTLNPALLLATLLTLWFLVHTLEAFHAVGAHLKVVKEDAFTSLQALWEAKAVSYDANTDESRWLLDRPHATEYENAFFQKAGQLVGFSPSDMYGKMATVTSTKSLPPGTSGYLAQELANITFEGEQEEATEALRTFAFYITLDKKIRQLENGGNHAEAVRFCISMAPGDSNWAFSQFDSALDKTIAINQKAFDTAVTQGFDDVKGLDILAPIIALVIVVLAFFGLRPRLHEYAR